jgi:hypothetical protein
MRYTIAVVTVLALCALAAVPAIAAQETVVYNGNLKSAPVPIAVGGWGSGTLQEVSEMQFQGPNSLKLTSQGDFQGGRLDFQKPIDISGYAGQPNAYIEVWVRPFFARPKPTETTTGAAAGQGAVGAAGTPTPTTPTTPRTSRLGAGGFRLGGRSGSRPGVPGTTTTPGATQRPYGATTPGYPSTGRSSGVGGVGLGRTRSGYAGGPTYGGTTRSRGGLGGTMRGGVYGGQTYGRGTARGGMYGPGGAYGGQYGSPYGGQYGGVGGGRTYRRVRTTTKPKAEETTAEPAQTAPASAQEAQFRTDGFRVQLATDKGTAVLSEYPIYPGDRNAAGWVRVGFPLSEFKGPIGDKLDRMVIYAEQPDTLYVGEVKLALDTQPIEAAPAAYPAITRVGQPVTFLVNAKPTLTPIRAVWDFDNSNGIQEQATGTRVVNVYTQPGDYEATVTTSDATGASLATKTYVILVRVK